MKNSSLQDSDNGFANNTNRINPSDAVSGKWFTTGGAQAGQLITTTTTLGVYMRDTSGSSAMDVGTDGQVSCDNTTLISNALKLWGLDPIDVLCNSDFNRVDLGSRQSVDTCKKASTDFERSGNKNDSATAFEKYIKNQVYGGKEPNLSDPQWYIYYRHSLNESCIAGIDSSTPDSTNYGSDNQYGYNGVKWVNVPTDTTQNVSIETGSYLGSWKTNNSVNLRAGSGPNYDNYSKSCSDTVSAMNGYAQAYKIWATSNRKAATNVNSTTNNQGSGDNNTTSCAIEGVGWIVCPMAGFLGMLADGLFGVLTTLLSYTPLTTSGPTYNTWEAMRNIANVAFVIAFLIIIFSQLTGVGVSNYGIKKLLPRIVIAAILVNVSYYICAIAVDLSNILGYSLQSLMTNAINTSGDASGNNLDVWGNLVGWILAGGAIAGTGVAAGLSIVAAGGWIPALALLLPVLIVVLVAVITVVFVLAARQALIVILIVLSPLAFVAYLLPNTEEWFTRWRKLFTTLLLLFPMVAIVFGGAQLAAAVVRADTHNPLIYILSLAIQVIPFFFVPILMRLGGGLLGKIGGIVNNPNKGPIDKLRKTAQEYGDTKRNQGRTAQLRRFEKSGKGGGFTRWQLRRGAIKNSSEAGLKDASTNYIADAALGGKDGVGETKFAAQMAGGDDKRAQAAVVASAVAQQKKAFNDEVSNMETLVKLRFDKPEEALQKALEEGDAITAVASKNLLFKQGGSGVSRFRQAVQDLEKSNTHINDEAIKKLREHVAENDGQYAKVKGADIVSWANTPGATLLSSSAGKLSDNDLAGQHAGSIEKMRDQGLISVEQAARMLLDPRVSANLDDKQKIILRSVAGNLAPPQTPQNPSSTPSQPSTPQTPTQTTPPTTPQTPATQPKNPPTPQTPTQPSSPPPSPMSNYAPRENGPNNFNVPHDMK